MSDIDATLTQSYEPPPPDDDLVGRLRAAVASVPDLHEAYLVARRTEWASGESLELGVLADVGDPSRSGRNRVLSTALAPFVTPGESAPLGWVAYARSPVPDAVRRAGIRLA